LELLATDYGRGYLDGVVGGFSMLLKISKEIERYKGEKEMLEEILERISKSLESIYAELKARNEDRKLLLNQAEVIEKTCLDIKEDPFGLNGLKRKAMADRVKQKE
jgi:ATP synthase F0 sector subunit B